ncbi:MAG: pyrroline-5-carboxylate reductase [Hadesarchaea archaeon]|nr:pyrroline-5-carboxylate reductase [Hadesarchaea archaeon]
MKVGFIGCGNLGSSLIAGLLKAGSLKDKEIIASDADEGKLEGVKKLGVEVTTDNKRVAAASDVIFIAVKPDVVGKVLDEIRKFSRNKLLVSVAAGVSTKFIEGKTEARVIRVMPNICGLVGEMASCFSPGSRATTEDRELIKRLLTSVGEAIEVNEGAMDAVTGLSGSGPAYFYLVIEAMQQAGVELGLSPDVALRLAAQTAKGAGEMALRSGKGLGELTRMVCSPKGTTVEGLRVLEERKVKEAVKEAVKAAARRARELSR